MTATHDTRAHLLAAVLANPDEDTPRLVYADWLEEFGEPERAEFIRVQVELGRLQMEAADNGTDCGEPTCGICVERRPLLARERELWDANSSVWRAQDAPWVTAAFTGANLPPYRHPSHVVYRRGFVHAVTCSGDDWCRHAGDVNVSGILAAHPVREMQLTAWPVWTPRLMRRTGFAPVYGFEVADEVLEVPLTEVPPDPGDFAILVLSRRWPTVTFRPPT